MTGGAPALAVVVPVLDDAAALPDAVVAVLSEDVDVEVVLAVAPSGDGSEEIARALAALDDRVRVVANPGGRTSSALNRAVAATSAKIVARIDARAQIEPGYLRLAAEVLEETGAAVVGGMQVATGETPFEEAVAAAMGSRFGTGDARFHYGGSAGPSDTVYLGVFRRAVLDAVGGYDETLVRNQDYELNWRIRASGGTVWFDPRLRVRYRPRGSLRALASQYFQYGQWKREVLRRHPRSLRWRQAVPPAALAADVAGVGLAVWRRQPRWLAVPGAYVAAVLAASAQTGPAAGRGARWLPLVFATMHLSWAAGFFRGPPCLARRPNSEPNLAGSAREPN